MYTGFPYMIPGANLASTAPVMNGLAGASNLGNALATGTGGSLLSRINWSSLLSNAQKTLNVVNQAIPLYYQVKPVFKNLRTLGKIGKEFTKIGLNNNDDANLTASVNNVDTNLSPNDNIIDKSIPEPKFFL